MTGASADVATDVLDADLPATVHWPRDADADAAPGVLLLHGSDGEPMDRTARLLAEAGFAAAAIQYFGAGDGVRDHLDEVPIEAIGSAVDALAEHDRVAGDEVGLYGASKGAECALVTASHRGNCVRAVVAVSPSCYVWEGLHRDWSPTGSSSWSLGGEGLPYVPFPAADAGGDSIRSYYEVALDRADPETVDAATIPVEEISAPLLLASGERDLMWPSAGYAETAMERLDAHGSELPHRHRSFEDAGHAIGPPGLRLDEIDERDLRMLGGTMAGTREAAEAFWPEACGFLETHLGP